MVVFNTGNGYQVTPRPRWGHGRGAHPRLQTILEGGRADYEQALTDLDVHRDALHEIRHVGHPQNPTMPFWVNVWFGTLDAASLVGFLLSRKPKRYLEIGSGHSTMFARHTIQRATLPTTITSIDPNPRAEIDAICDRVLRCPLEDCDITLFDELEPGDILFFDGSHRVWQNSDVTTFFLDVLPRLKSGVLVHVHDIFLPDDYPPAWDSWMYSEQYLLGAMLLCGAPPFRVILPNYFVSTDGALSEQVRETFRAPSGGRDIPTAYVNAGSTPPVSFWIETRSAAVV
jgi:methyltransferase family protein